jgi:hypothetical protein
MKLIRRLFASDSSPWHSATNTVSVNISGSVLSFDCPGAYPWSSSPEIHNALVDKSDARDTQLDEEFRFSQKEYGGHAIFYREWSHWGNVFRPKYIAVTSLRVWLIHIAKETETDSLYVGDYIMKKLPLPNFGDGGACLNEGEKVTKSSGGLLGNPGDDQRTGFNRVCIKKASGRELVDYSLVTLSCEHALVFEIYQAQAPERNRFQLSELTDQASNIIDSICLKLSSQELMAKEQVLRKYAEQIGGVYDEEYGCVFTPL